MLYIVIGAVAGTVVVAIVAGVLIYRHLVRNKTEQHHYLCDPPSVASEGTTPHLDAAGADPLAPGMAKHRPSALHKVVSFVAGPAISARLASARGRPVDPHEALELSPFRDHQEDAPDHRQIEVPDHSWRQRTPVTPSLQQSASLSTPRRTSAESKGGQQSSTPASAQPSAAGTSSGQPLATPRFEAVLAAAVPATPVLSGISISDSFATPRPQGVLQSSSYRSVVLEPPPSVALLEAQLAQRQGSFSMRQSRVVVESTPQSSSQPAAAAPEKVSAMMVSPAQPLAAPPVEYAGMSTPLIPSAPPPVEYAGMGRPPMPPATPRALPPQERHLTRAQHSFSPLPDLNPVDLSSTLSAAELRRPATSVDQMKQVEPHVLAPVVPPARGRARRPLALAPLNLVRATAYVESPLERTPPTPPDRLSRMYSPAVGSHYDTDSIGLQFGEGDSDDVSVVSGSASGLVPKRPFDLQRSAAPSAAVIPVGQLLALHREQSLVKGTQRNDGQGRGSAPPQRPRPFG
jgi:hypothetical protein